MSRRRLPNRRPSLTVEIMHDGCVYAVILGFVPADWWLGEIFAHGAKVGSAMDAILDDGCIALSLLLQHGVDPVSLGASMGRLGDSLSAASIIGALADLAAQEARCG